jgi:conjugal transfer ATP-binding protein TraC
MERFSTFKTLPAQTVINLLPMQAETMGGDSPAMMLGGRRGQLSFWDPFSNPQGNYNVVVAASSGAGKSVFNQEYILSHISSGGRAWIIDVGRSYYKLTKLLGGQFIEFNSTSNICLNPFSDIDDIKDKEAGYMDLLKPLVAQMASPYQQLSQVQLSEIEQAILNVWDKKSNDMTISDVAAELLRTDDNRAKDLGKMLFPYTAKGMYGHYFEGRSTFKYNSPLVCLELEELKTKEDLKSVVLMLLMFQMTQSMYLGDRKTKTTILIDEAWDMLKNIQGSSFIEAGCRRARKYNGNFVICTQSINDCFENKASLEAYNNSDWTVILRHRDTALKGVIGSSRLDISEHAALLAKSLESKAGEFSEALIKGPGGAFLGRLILDPFSIELFSTKGDDFAKINTIIGSGASMEEALNKMVLEKAS